MVLETKEQHSSNDRSQLYGTRRPRSPKTLKIYKHDIPKRVLNHILTNSIVAVDTETGPKPFGLDFRKGKVLLVQIATPDHKVYMVRNPDQNSKHLKELLDERSITKVFHHAAFDIKFLKASLGVETVDVACTKVMMKIAYPHITSGLGNSIENILKVKIDKDIDHSGWDKEELSERQLEYAANDVLYLIELYEELIERKTIPLKYYDIIDAIVVKSYAEVEGYTDLFDYSQNDHRQTKRERDWWRNKFNE